MEKRRVRRKTGGVDGHICGMPLKEAVMTDDYSIMLMAVKGQDTTNILMNK